MISGCCWQTISTCPHDMLVYELLRIRSCWCALPLEAAKTLVNSFFYRGWTVVMLSWQVVHCQPKTNFSECWTQQQRSPAVAGSMIMSFHSSETSCTICIVKKESLNNCVCWHTRQFTNRHWSKLTDFCQPVASFTSRSILQSVSVRLLLVPRPCIKFGDAIAGPYAWNSLP